MQERNAKKLHSSSKATPREWADSCAAVNSFFGDYTFDGKTLSFDHVGMTRMMGDEESMKIEDAVIDAINKAKTAEVQKDKATLFDAEGNEVIELKK